MIPVAQAKKDLMYSENLKDVIDVLRLMSSLEFSRLSARRPKEDVLKEHIIDCFGMLKERAEESPFFEEKKTLPTAFLLVCSDEGFLGKVNTLVVNIALNRGLEQEAKFIVLGERGARLLKESGVEYKSFPAIDNDIKVDNIIELAEYIMGLYKEGTIGGFQVIYMKFSSFTSHAVDISKLLPCEDMSDHIRGKETQSVDPDILVEPTSRSVVEYLVKLWMENSMYNIFWSSKLSEWAVRVMHLTSSSEEIKNITGDLKFKYFKSLHALSDKVIREIFAARTMTMG